MDRLPDEILLYILSYLEPSDIVHAQKISIRLLRLGRDETLWKDKCFDNSNAEAQRRRRFLTSKMLDLSFVELRRSVDELQAHRLLTKNYDTRCARARALANWDPSSPNERVDFYQEYMHRHAPIEISWLEDAHRVKGAKASRLEATGMGVLRSANTKVVHKVVAPLEDGSVCIWDIDQSRPPFRTLGSIQATTAPHILYGKNNNRQSSSVSRETGAVENVCVDDQRKKAFIAAYNRLSEIDLETMQVIRQDAFSFPITALSAAQHPTPLTVGTINTLHLHDIRDRHRLRSVDCTSNTCEFISDGPSTSTSPVDRNFIRPIIKSHVSLSQPMPLSILHPPYFGSPTLPSDEIWVAGRFTSLLVFDRRFWPRFLRTPVHSGARLSALTYLPHPFISRSLDLVQHPDVEIRERHNAKAAPSHSIVAAGEYKGKGSLELYGLHPPSAEPEGDSPVIEKYQNRQTASKSRLLSVCSHGARIVFSDGDGNVVWMERDCSSLVRRFNLNEFQTYKQDRSTMRANSQPRTSQPHNAAPALRASYTTTDDLVQQIIPAQSMTTLGSKSRLSDLLLWSGDGKIGLLGFGHQPSFEHPRNDYDVVEDDREQEYEQAIRVALERQANETRFIGKLTFGK